MRSSESASRHAEPFVRSPEGGTDTPADAVVYDCQVMHRRQFTPAYRFNYRAAYLLIDIDQVAKALRHKRWISHNRFNLFGFYEQDFGPGKAGPLRPWLTALLRARGIELDGGRVRLLCLPRVLGYQFNPISIFYCEHADGSLRAILCQVNNTFGERHFYVLARGGAAMPYAAAHSKQKIFHVSPFIGMRARYRFRFNEPGARHHLVIREYQDDRLMLVASLNGRRRTLSDRQLFGCFLRIPLMTLKVIAAIHWQGLKIWLHGGRYHRKPEPPAHDVT